jgi:hypothetical protein
MFNERAPPPTAVHRTQHLNVANGIKAEALRDSRLHQMQVLPGARHRHVKQTAIFLNCSRLPTAMSEGIQPSLTLSTNTMSHSCPLAEWIVESTT